MVLQVDNTIQLKAASISVCKPGLKSPTGGWQQGALFSNSDSIAYCYIIAIISKSTECEPALGMSPHSAMCRGHSGVQIKWQKVPLPPGAQNSAHLVYRHRSADSSLAPRENHSWKAKI